ncbi:hypothetical protein G7Y89_g5693 [Cudoniella acicularis]|uniref:Uncharacterized protein n=1 Tax=Cudoniella acicularis TaxID=354080 RepID=A0A8H4W690_9HELO|nr:hypothetical protein G7Y89_g5693 [Cudoniella acicularis]
MARPQDVCTKDSSLLNLLGASRVSETSDQLQLQDLSLDRRRWSPGMEEEGATRKFFRPCSQSPPLPYESRLQGAFEVPSRSTYSYSRTSKGPEGTPKATFVGLKLHPAPPSSPTPATPAPPIWLGSETSKLLMEQRVGREINEEEWEGGVALRPITTSSPVSNRANITMRISLLFILALGGIASVNAAAVGGKKGPKVAAPKAAVADVKATPLSAAVEAEITKELETIAKLKKLPKLPATIPDAPGAAKVPPPKSPSKRSIQKRSVFTNAVRSLRNHRADEDDLLNELATCDRNLQTAQSQLNRIIRARSAAQRDWDHPPSSAQLRQWNADITRLDREIARETGLRRNIRRELNRVSRAIYNDLTYFVACQHARVRLPQEIVNMITNMAYYEQFAR